MDEIDSGKVIFKVSQLVDHINQVLEMATSGVYVEGEVSSFKVSKDKWIFFDIKDDRALINCFMPLWQMNFPIEDGMKIRIKGRAKLTDWGRFSLTVLSAEPIGEGSLKRSYEILKQKLLNEGLFDESRKRTVPLVPEKIAIISSRDAAGLEDYLKLVNQRFPFVDIDLYDVLVQGEQSAGQIISAISAINGGSKNYDMLVILRGGGSLEDLMSFNSEEVVRAIAASRIPTLVGVGHEKDETLAGLAADILAATPSHGAVLSVPDKKEMLALINIQKNSFVGSINNLLDRHAELIKQARIRLSSVLDEPLSRLVILKTRLELLGPNTILKRGYSIAYKTDEKGRKQVIKSAKQVAIQEVIELKFYLDAIKVRVENERTIT